MAEAWSNWSGSQQHKAALVALPSSEAELAEIVARANREGKTVRAVGTSHSFVPFWTDDFIVSLDNMKGLVDHDAETGQATFWAGSKLHEIGEPLWDLGLSMQNMGDIDRQSIAGAINTGTHGTGITMRNIPSQLVKLRLLLADGSFVELDASDGDRFKGAQVAMGTLGIVTKATLQCLPRYYLHERNWVASVDECAGQCEELIATNRHFEFFWDPQSVKCAMKTLNVTDREEDAKPGEHEEIGRSYRIIPSTRDMKFNEIEFSLPYDAGWECFMAVRRLMQTSFPKVRWPLEYRTLKADDMLLSSASGRDTVTISAHEGIKYPFDAFFAAVEDVFRQYDGRPHWGKVHTHRYGELSARLPGFDRFCEIRKSMDPEGRFLNSFLCQVFGIR